MLLNSTQSLRVRARQTFVCLSACQFLIASLLVGSIPLTSATAAAGLNEQQEIVQDGNPPQATDDSLRASRPQDDAPLVEQVSEAVRLLGRANRSQQVLGPRLMVSPDGKRLATNYGGREVVILDREPAKVVQTISFDVGQRLPIVQDVCFSNSGKHWVVALTIMEPNDLEVDRNIADDQPDDWKLERGNYLVIYADGKLIGLPQRVGEPSGFEQPRPRVLFSPNERWLVWERHGVAQSFDLKQNKRLAAHENCGECFFSSADVLTSWTALQSQNLSTGQTTNWEPPNSIQGAAFNSVSADGRALVVSAKNGVVFFDLDSQNTASFNELPDTRSDPDRAGQPHFDGKLSKGGRYFAGRGSAPSSAASLFFVYDVQSKKFALEPTPLITSGHFIGDEAKILALSAIDGAWHELTLGPESRQQIRSLLGRYPLSRQIQFANQDRHLVIGHRSLWIDRDTGKSLSRDRQDASDVLERYPSPWDTSSFEFTRTQVANYAVKQRQMTTGQSQQLYSHNSTSHVAGLLGNLFGGPIEPHGVMGLHLACAPDKKHLWELRHESRLGFIFRQWDLDGQRVDWEKTFKVRTPIVGVYRLADISTDGSRFAVTTNEQLWVVDAAEGRAVTELQLPASPSKITLNHNGSLIAATYRSDMRAANRIQVFEVASGKTVLSLAGDRFLAPKFHAQEQRLAIVRTGTPNRLTIYDTTTWQPIHTHETAHAPATALDLSADFHYMSMSLSDTRIEVWDLSKLGFAN